MHLLPAPAGVNHGAALVALGEDRLLACWYSGRTEAGRDAVILCARSPDGGESWSPPQRVSTPGATDLGGRRPAKSVGNVVLAKDSAGRLVMISGEVQSRPVLGIETCRSWRCGRIAFRVMADARAWSPPTRLDDRPGALPRSRPLTVPGIGDLVPVYREGRGASVLALDLARLQPGRPPSPTVLPIPASGSLLQPSLARQGGRIAAYLRDRRRRFVWVSWLERGAWTKPEPTDLPNPGSAVEAFEDKGQIALVYNPSRRDRATLALAFSQDGVHFPRGCVLVTKGAAGDVAYPAVAAVGDGVGLVFSIEDKRRVAFIRLTRADLDACAAGKIARTY
jgi:predicted neuraminidase